MAGKGFEKETGFRLGLCKVKSQGNRDKEKHKHREPGIRHHCRSIHFEGDFRNESGPAYAIYSSQPLYGVISEQDADL